MPSLQTTFGLRLFHENRTHFYRRRRRKCVQLASFCSWNFRNGMDAIRVIAEWIRWQINAIRQLYVIKRCLPNLVRYGRTENGRRKSVQCEYETAFECYLFLSLPLSRSLFESYRRDHQHHHHCDCCCQRHSIAAFPSHFQ